MPGIKLKSRVSSLDEVPEQYRAQYLPAEDGKSWAVDELEIEDVTGLKAKNAGLIDEYKKTQDELRKLKETYGDLDPETARAAQKKLEELENKSLMDEGKFEELFIKRTEAMKRDHEHQVELLAHKIEEGKKRAATLEQQLQRTTIRNELSTQAPKLHIKPEFVSLLQLAADKDWVLDDEGKAVWKVDGQIKLGKDALTPASMVDYLTDMIAATPSLVEGSTGTGANGNGRPGNNGVISISRADAQDMRKYAAIKEQARQAGIDVSQIQVTD